MFALAMGAVIIAAAAVVLYEINSSLTREAASRLDLSATKMDVALYEAKKRGRNTTVEYQSGLRIVSDRTARRIG